MKETNKQIALISTFAIIILVVTRLPGIPIIGGVAKGGGNIELSVILYPIIGIILGPVAGASASLIGVSLIRIVGWSRLRTVNIERGKVRH
jgi:uncharacterized membrane protein